VRRTNCFAAGVRRGGPQVALGARAEALRAPFITINEPTWQVIADIFGEVPAARAVANRRWVVYHGAKEIFDSIETNVYCLRTPFVPYPSGTNLPRNLRLPRRLRRARADTDGWISSGNRAAWMCHARTNSQEAAGALIFEFVEDGWVFWAPTGPRTGFLQFTLANAKPRADPSRQLWPFTRLMQNCNDILAPELCTS
jgi:hypothetical protein